jgi:hypothetical protein
MFDYRIKLLCLSTEKKLFKESYESISGLPLPDHYLYASDVFGLIFKGRIIGGFILSCDHPLRTYRLFANEINWSDINSRLGHFSLCEICCLWLAREHWGWFTTSLLWFNAARIVSRRKEDLVIFGTVSRGNNALYGSVRHAELIYHGLVDIRGDKKNSWIYAIPVKWFFIDINWGIAVRFYHHVLKLISTPGSKYVRKHLGIKPSLK